MQYCFYLDWGGLTPNEWAAWIQAGGSVIAIFAAAWLPLWHRKQDLRRQLDTYVEMISVAQSYAADDATNAGKWIDNLAVGWGNDHWDAVISALKGVEYHHLPDFRLFVPLQDALRNAEVCKAILAEAIANAAQLKPITAEIARRLDARERRLTASYHQAVTVANRYGGRTPVQIVRWYWLKLRMFFQAVWRRAAGKPVPAL